MDLMIFDLVGIERVQRLTALVQHEVRYVYDIIDRTQTDSEQAVLEPFRRLFDRHAIDAHARITRTCIRCINYHLDRQIVIFDLKVLYRWLLQTNILTVGFVVSVQIACNAKMTCRIRTVRRDIHFDDRVVLDVVVVRSLHTHRRVGGKHDDTGMVGTYAYLILRANHAPALLAAQLTFLDRERLLAVIEHGTYGRYNHFLSCSYVRRTANDRQRLRLTDVHFRDM